MQFAENVNDGRLECDNHLLPGENKRGKHKQKWQDELPYIDQMHNRFTSQRHKTRPHSYYAYNYSYFGALMEYEYVQPLDTCNYAIAMDIWGNEK